MSACVQTCTDLLIGRCCPNFWKNKNSVIRCNSVIPGSQSEIELFWGEIELLKTELINEPLYMNSALRVNIQNAHTLKVEFCCTN